MAPLFKLLTPLLAILTSLQPIHAGITVEPHDSEWSKTRSMSPTTPTPPSSTASPHPPPSSPAPSPPPTSTASTPRPIYETLSCPNTPTTLIITYTKTPSAITETSTKTTTLTTEKPPRTFTRTVTATPEQATESTTTIYITKTQSARISTTTIYTTAAQTTPPTVYITESDTTITKTITVTAQKTTTTVPSKTWQTLATNPNTDPTVCYSSHPYCPTPTNYYTYTSTDTPLMSFITSSPITISSKTTSTSPLSCTKTSSKTGIPDGNFIIGTLKPCSTTYSYQYPTHTIGPTVTVHTTTEHVTLTVPCAGCAFLVAATTRPFVISHGTANRTTTVTETRPTFELVFECLRGNATSMSTSAASKTSTSKTHIYSKTILTLPGL